MGEDLHEMWQCVALLQADGRRAPVPRAAVTGGGHNREVRERLGAVMFVDPELVECAVRSGRRR